MPQLRELDLFFVFFVPARRLRYLRLIMKSRPGKLARVAGGAQIEKVWPFRNFGRILDGLRQGAVALASRSGCTVPKNCFCLTLQWSLELRI